jgi:hypothetical protein
MNWLFRLNAGALSRGLLLGDGRMVVRKTFAFSQYTLYIFAKSKTWGWSYAKNENRGFSHHQQ